MAKSSKNGLWGLSVKPYPKDGIGRTDADILEANARTNELAAYRRRKGEVCTSRDSNTQTKAKADADPRYRLLVSLQCSIAAKRSKGIDIPLTIGVIDIPTPIYCKLLGVKLDYGRAAHGKVPPHAATVDRIRPELGYVKGNIQVISFLANRMKNNASLEELVTFARNVLKLYAKGEQSS